MTILITGGAGYIGSHVVRELSKNGIDLLVYDNLSTGYRAAVTGSRFVQGDLANRELLLKTMRDYQVTGVIHLAGFISVGESMYEPGKYFQNNLVNGINLLNAMVQAGVGEIVFSSSAAVYGEPREVPITEEHPTNPASVYGVTKLMMEETLKWYGQAYGIRYIALRYFNAAGADPEGGIGEAHRPETHLIPLVLQAALGQRESVSIYGVDYPTPDGSCIRDYIHVSDLAAAHLAAVNYLAKGGHSGVFNVGSGKGYSVLEVIKAAERVTGRPIRTEIAGRRPGDTPVLVAWADKIRRKLGWQPRYNSLEEIIETAWEWHRKHPRGYEE